MRLPKSKRELVPLLEARGIRLRREWGQNFLLEPNTLAAITRDAAVQASDVVLEIGPGAGALTEFLMEQSRLVVAVEIDRGLANFVADGLRDPPSNLLLIRADAMGRHNSLNPFLLSTLEALLASGVAPAPSPLLDEPPPVDLESVADADLDHDDEAEDSEGLIGHEYLAPPRREQVEVLCTPPDEVARACAGAPLRIVANLPYSISSPLLIGLFESHLPWRSMTVLLQLEVARKLVAKIGDDDWGLLGLIRSMWASARIVRKIGRRSFWPAPQVDSALVELTPAPKVPDAVEYLAIKRVASSLYRYRRKSVLNGAQHGLGMSSAEARAWLDRAGVAPTQHAESLSVEDFRGLARALSPAVEPVGSASIHRP